MKCFNWHNHSSDYLDGTLPALLQHEADNHLQACDSCSERFKHYRLIISSIANQPKSALPAPIRRSPFSAVLPRPDGSFLSLARWQRIPWYLRTVLEAVGIVILVLVAISSTPKIRAIYEKNIEKNLTDFRENLNITESSEDPIDAGLAHLGQKVPLSGPQPPSSSDSTEPSSAENDGLSSEDDGEEEDAVQVGRSQLWRFTLSTVIPDDIRPQVIKALTELGIAPQTPGLGGTQVPGGIEFDLILPQSLVPAIKHSLERLVPHTIEEATNKPGPENFSWYRVKSKRSLPEGKSQVVIWLSQPH